MQSGEKLIESYKIDGVESFLLILWANITK